MAHTGDNHSRDRDQAPEILASITSRSSHNLDMMDQGEMTKVMIDHNPRVYNAFFSLFARRILKLLLLMHFPRFLLDVS